MFISKKKLRRELWKAFRLGEMMAQSKATNSTLIVASSRLDRELDEIMGRKEGA